MSGALQWLSSLAFSQDGSRLATGDATGKMRVWSTDTWQLLAEHTSERVRALVFHGSARLIASNGYRAIRVWKLPEFTEEMLFVHEDNVHQLVILPDNERLLSGANDGTVRLWNLLTGEALAVLRHPGSSAGELHVTADGRYAVIGSYASQFTRTYVWSLDSLAEIAAFSQPDARAIGFTEDSRHLLMWSTRDDGNYSLVRFWDLSSRQFVDSLRVDTRGKQAFGPQSMQLISVSTNTGSIERHDLTTKSLLRRAVVYMNHVEDVAFSPGGEWVAAAVSRSIHIWDTASGEPLLTLQTAASIRAIAFSANCLNLLIADSKGLSRRRFLDPHVSKPVREGYMATVDYAPEAGRVAMSWNEGDVGVFNASFGTEIARFENHPDRVRTIALSQNGALLAVSGQWQSTSPSAWIWNVATRRLLGKVPVVPRGAGALAFSPDNRFLAGSGWRQGVQLWSLNPLARVDSIGTDASKALSFSPDGRWLAWGRPGRQPLQLLEVDSGARAAGHQAPIYLDPDVLTYSPGGSMLAMSGGGHLLVWDGDAPAEELLPSPCGHINLQDFAAPQSVDPVVIAPGDTTRGDSTTYLELSLAPGRPNPSRDRTIIPFYLPDRALVHIEVCNLAGQVIRQLAQREYDLGSHEVTWDGVDDRGRAVAAGVYLIRLRTGGTQRHGKLLRLR